MQYSMQNSFRVMLLVAMLFACSAGCTEPPATTEVVTTAATTPTPEPLPETPETATSIGDLALDLPDLPDDYILRDRSVMISPDVSQLARNLGWQGGYFVVFDRVGRIKTDQTRIRQSISIFPAEVMDRVFNLEKLAFEGGDTLMASPYEIPFPEIGGNSIAYRLNNMPEEGQVTYTVLFTRNEAFERITMSGTSTDYETLKDIVQKAEAKVP
jgi:hypothetical protein